MRRIAKRTPIVSISIGNLVFNSLAQESRIEIFFFSSRRRHTRSLRDWSSDVCSSDLQARAARSTQFLLPTEESVEVAEELARRYPVPLWQFTLSATQANTEAIRLARAVTGREVIVLFEGHYHGHFEEGLVDVKDGRPSATQRGLSKGVTGRVRIAQFNDPDTLRAALEPSDVALVLTEPAMTNSIHLLLPEPGWH